MNTDMHGSHGKIRSAPSGGRNIDSDRILPTLEGRIQHGCLEKGEALLHRDRGAVIQVTPGGADIKPVRRRQFLDEESRDSRFALDAQQFVQEFKHRPDGISHARRHGG